MSHPSFSFLLWIKKPPKTKKKPTPVLQFQLFKKLFKENRTKNHNDFKNTKQAGREGLFSICELTQEGWAGQGAGGDAPAWLSAPAGHGELPSFSLSFIYHARQFKEPEGQEELGIQCHPAWLCPVLQGNSAVSQMGWNCTNTSPRASLSACRLQLREKPQVTECLGWEGASTRVPWQVENLAGMKTSSSRSSPAQASSGMHKPAPLGL